LGSLGHPEWGRFKLGHTQPDLSSSGLLSVLLEAYAGANKLAGLSVADVEAEPTRALVATVERAIVRYGRSTGSFAEAMVTRGPSYLSAAVVYENLVIDSYRSPNHQPLVAIYPREGTVWADHPYALVEAEWVGVDERTAAEAFLTFLKGRTQQERATVYGFRPADPTMLLGAPVDAAHGCDAKEPRTLLEIPDAATLARLGPLWEDNKRASDVILLFDVSGSMEGKPLAEAQRAAKGFLDGLHARDTVTLGSFDKKVHELVGPLAMKTGRDTLKKDIDALKAYGGTALYDAVAAAYDEAHKRVAADPDRTHTVLVLTDGKDEDSTLTLEELKGRFERGGAQRVYVSTIAYGPDASEAVLREIAEANGGSSAKGSVDDIVQVFQDLASQF
jgi:Ca-activated chloride channel family protein